MKWSSLPRRYMQRFRVQPYPKQGKDYNEWLMLQKGISPRQKARDEPER